VTSFACYKYLISQGLIFSGAELISSFYGISLAYLAYFLIDAVIVVTLSYCMATCQPADRLVPARPTDSLFSASVIAGVLGPHVIFQCVMAASLYTITGEPGYIRWPAQFAEGGEQWWELADGWEATVILFCFAVQMTTLSLTFSFGGVFRRPLWWNWKLCTSWLIFTTSFGFLLLFPVRDTQRATWLHAVFHIASIPFNSQSTLSPVWVAWQQEGNEPNEQGMPISLRARLAAILLAGAIVVASFEYCVVLRLLAKREQTRDTTS
jgi:cation-transporting ATPase 13A2